MLEQETQMLGGVAGRLLQISEQLGQIAGRVEVEPAPAPAPAVIDDWCCGSEVGTDTNTLPDTESWVNSIIHGSDPGGETDIAIVKKALAMLAGSPYLEDAEIMGRYRDAQFIASGGNEAVFDKGNTRLEEILSLETIDLRKVDKAGCEDSKDPDTFFPAAGKSQLAVKRECHICKIRQHCLDTALNNNDSDDFGIRGGLSGRQRQKVKEIKKKLGPAAAQKKVEAIWEADVKKIDDAIAAGRLQ